MQPVDLFNSKAATAAADDTTVNVALQATVMVPLLLLSLAPHQVRLWSVSSPWDDLHAARCPVEAQRLCRATCSYYYVAHRDLPPPKQTTLHRLTGRGSMWLALCLLMLRRRTSHSRLLCD